MRPVLPVALLLGVASAGWREECNFGGNAMFNVIHETPYLSTLCPSYAGIQICTMLDLSYCLMNSHGHLAKTINGGFDKSCVNCHLTGDNGTVFFCSCRMFGKNAPYQDAEIDLEDVVYNKDGRLTCWDSKPMTCPGFNNIITPP
ncbi:Cyanovirin-N [Astrocystis sublimbata]|nr:Cyanovirin-N [Astrocystis sublimbata]